MTSNLWTHQFCLACDKQLQSDGAAYCSESCRLADHEKASTTLDSQVSSPDSTPSFSSWPVSKMTMLPSPTAARSSFHLSPAYDLAAVQTPAPAPARSFFHNYSVSAGEPSAPSTVPSLTPSSSRTSLCSIRSLSSTMGTMQLSDKSRKELKAYAMSFEQVRLQRRRSR